MEYTNRLKLAAKDLNDGKYKEAAKKLKMVAQEVEEEADVPEITEYKKLLTMLKGKEGLKKIKIFLDNQRVRKPIVWWLTKLDKGEGAGAVDFQDMIKKIKIMLKRDLPAARFLKMILDYGISNGHIALNRLLEKGRAKMTLMKEKS